MPAQEQAKEKKTPWHHVSIDPKRQFKSLVYKGKSHEPEHVFPDDQQIEDGTPGFVLVVHEDRTEEHLRLAYHARKKQWILDGHGDCIGKNVGYVNPRPEECRQFNTWVRYASGPFMRHTLLFSLPL